MASSLQFPLVESTATADDDVILIAPWKIYQFYPTWLSSHLETEGKKVVADDNIYMLMTNGNQCPDELNGKLDQFCNMWVINSETTANVSLILDKLNCEFSLLHVVLVERHVFTNSIEIPMLVFVKNRSKDMESLKKNLQMIKEGGENSKQYSFEIDYGQAIETWAMNVLKREFICIGGRFCITNGSSFNHVLDWNNLLSCLPCLPCGLMAGSAYRVGRKIRYLETITTPQTNVLLVGSTKQDNDTQRLTLVKLMDWVSESSLNRSKEKPPPKREVSALSSGDVQVVPVPIQTEDGLLPKQTGDDPVPDESTDDPLPNQTEDNTKSESENQTSNHQRTSNTSMPLVDSTSMYSKHAYDPLSYPALVKFLAPNKTSLAKNVVTTMPRSLNGPARSVDPRKITVKSSSHGDNIKTKTVVRVVGASAASKV